MNKFGFRLIWIWPENSDSHRSNSAIAAKYSKHTAGTADDELWPMIQKKLDVLNKVGLSKDNFQVRNTVLGTVELCCRSGTLTSTRNYYFLDPARIKEQINSNFRSKVRPVDSQH